MKYLADTFGDVFGSIPVPAPLSRFGDPSNGGIGTLLNLIFKVIFVGGGIFALFNLILAGYAFMSAGEDPKKMEAAWGKIWQTAMGLVFMAGAFVLAAIFGQLIFGQWDFILNPNIPTL